MNVTQANAVNVLTRALGVEDHREPPTDVETRAALNVLVRGAHKALGAGVNEE